MKITERVIKYTRGELSDEEMTRWLKDVCAKGLSYEKTRELTQAMVDSGETVDLSGVAGFKADKHSTGGVGDKTTLVVAPLAAACGVTIAKMSGRALGHTGGTLDRLESIPGFRVELDRRRFIDQLNTIGVAVISQSSKLVPADKKIYALRDRTGTVASLSLIASSVMSKKIAAGADFIVLDVKAGNGAFMLTTEAALELAELCVRLGRDAGRQVAALVTDMDRPLGAAVGNALEVREAIAVLRGQGPADVSDLSVDIVALMVCEGHLAPSIGEARHLVESVLAAGAGLAKFRELIEAQDGDARVIDEPERLVVPPAEVVCAATGNGYITSMDTAAIGTLAKRAGGIVFRKKTGDAVAAGEIMAVIYASESGSAESVAAGLSRAITIGRTPAPTRPLVLARINGAQPRARLIR